MMEDLKQLAIGKGIPGLPLPDYSKEQYVHVHEVQFRNRLGPDDLEIAVIEASNIKPPSGTIAVDSYVAVNCPFTTGEPLWRTHKESGTNSPVFKEVHSFKIDRTKRTLVKTLERKKDRKSVV